MIAQLCVIYFPPLQSIFQTEPLSLSDLVFVVVISSTILFVDAFRKYLSPNAELGLLTTSGLETSGGVGGREERLSSSKVVTKEVGGDSLGLGDGGLFAMATDLVERGSTFATQYVAAIRARSGRSKKEDEEGIPLVGGDGEDTDVGGRMGGGMDMKRSKSALTMMV